MNLNANINLSETHRHELHSAMLLLENPGFAAKVTGLIGMPIEKALKLLPKNWNKKIGTITNNALIKAVNTAIITMKDNPGEESSDRLHKLGVAITGGMGGFFGLPALAIELPVSTTIMLRSIAAIARAEGETLNDFSTRLACLEVFALGGNKINDDSTESGYFIVRTALARTLSQAAKYITTKSLTEEGAPVLLRFILNIAQRFSIQVTEKAAAQTIPIIGAAGGAIINTIFIDYFQDIAKGHFTVRRLEKIYNKEIVKGAYEELMREERLKTR